MDDTGAVILAGGLSRRFGSPKARASWRGATFVEHLLRALPCERTAVVLVVRAEQDDGRWPVGTVVHDDPALAAGPLRGIVGGLERCARPWNWVLACDLPGMRPALLHALRAAAVEGALAVVPRWNDRLQPLCALYATDAAPRLRACLERGQHAATGAVASLPLVEFDEASCRRIDPHGFSFVNVNHREDLFAFERCESYRASEPHRRGVGP